VYAGVIPNNTGNRNAGKEKNTQEKRGKVHQVLVIHEWILFLGSIFFYPIIHESVG
jgi:hypothetical protein